MKRVVYAGESFLTADSVADALTEVAVAIARAHTVEAVDLPSVDAQGRARTVRIVVGPASQLATMAEHCTFDEPPGGDFVPRMRARVAALGPREITPAPRMGHESDLGEIDFL